MNLFEILMLLMTILIAFGVYRSFKAKNMLATVYGVISLAVFLFSDALIFYYAFIKPVG